MPNYQRGLQTTLEYKSASFWENIIPQKIFFLLKIDHIKSISLEKNLTGY